MDLAAAFQEGFAHHRAGHLDDARRVYGEILALHPDHFDALHALALVEFNSGEHEQAAGRLARALAINATVAPAYNNYGVILNVLENFEAAIDSFERAIALDANYAEAYLNRGRAYGSLARMEEARADFEHAVRLNPNHPGARNDLGKVLGADGDNDGAIAQFDRAVALAPEFAEAHSNRAVALEVLGHDAAAIESFMRAGALRPDDAILHKQTANALTRCDRLDDAAASYDRALDLDPECAVTHNHRGVVRLRMGRREDALADYQKAGVLDPSYAEAFLNAAAILNDLKRFDEALIAANRAVELRPQFAPAHQARGAALDGLGRVEDAIADYGAALAHDPDTELVAGRRLFLCQQICRWESIDADTAAVLARVEAGNLAAAPFYLLTVPASLKQQMQIAQLYCAKNVAAPTLPAIPRRAGSGKIRVGYFSADFHTHAVSHLAAGLFEAHDRTGFEVFGFTYAGVAADDMTRRLEGAFDRFIDISGLSDRDAASLARELKLDIAVDLTGHTFDGRPGLFAERAAPVQAAYLGYPGTTGLAAMDYLIADATLVPPEHETFYTEKIVRLPSYQVNDWKRSPPGRTPSRQSLGLPDGAFVFCAFNNTYKITPDLFEIWMRLLTKVAGSVLWLRHTSDAASANLRKEAERRGIAADRLIFAPRAPMAEHLARHQAADLFLDSFVYNAQTTASDALWSGLPVLTKLGESFASRGAASVLTAAGLPELITTTVAQYESLALDLAAHPNKIAVFKRRLSETRGTCALFDTARFARSIESAFRIMNAGR